MSRRRRARASSTSMTIATPSFMVTASGWAPPMPPRPAVRVTVPRRRPTEMLARRLGERLVRALEDALGPDVDPRPGGHLAVHHQPASLEVAEVLPGRPLADEVRVGDEDPRRPRVRAQDADRLARLDEQRLVALEGAELADDRVEGGPRACRPPGPAVDDEVVGVLGDLRIEVVHEHPERRFLLPAAAGQLGAAGGADGSGADGAHRLVEGFGIVARRLLPQTPADSGKVAPHHREPLVVDRAARTRPTARSRASPRSWRPARRRSSGRSRRR